MDELKTLYVTNRKDWRAWLKMNFNKETEVWLVYPGKSSGKPRISYNDAVEEALCFGWIDSQVRSIGEDNGRTIGDFLLHIKEYVLLTLMRHGIVPRNFKRDLPILLQKQGRISK